MFGWNAHKKELEDNVINLRILDEIISSDY